MDATSGLVCAVWSQLLSLFIDPEVVIALPSSFNSEEMKTKLDKKAGEVFF